MSFTITELVKLSVRFLDVIHMKWFCLLKNHKKSRNIRPNFISRLFILSLDFYYIFMLKYIAVKVFVTDGLAE